jgi:hypothetical protein
VSFRPPGPRLVPVVGPATEASMGDPRALAVASLLHWDAAAPMHLRTPEPVPTDGPWVAHASIRDGVFAFWI